MTFARPSLPLCCALLVPVLGACRMQPETRSVLGIDPARPDRARPSELDWTEPVALEEDPRASAEPAASSEPEPASEAKLRPRIGDDTLLELDLRGVPLSEALHLIASHAGVNIYLDAGLDQAVDASFPSVRLDDALAAVLRQNGLALVEDPPGIFWVTRSDGSESLSRRFQLQSVDGAGLLDNLKVLVPSATLVLDANQNFLVVRAPESELAVIDEYLQAADRVKRQVLIEVEILEVILDDEFDLGIQSLLSEPNFLGEAGLLVDKNLSTDGDAFSATFDLNDFSLSATINALATFGTVNVISSPRVLAITNTEASIDVVREIPYIETTTDISSGAGSGTVGTTSQQTVAFKEAGIKLRVTPVIQENQLVQLAVNQEFSEVIDFFLGIPVLDTRKVENHFVVRGNQAVLLGGLMQNRKREQDNGVPVLMHIPLIGRLFRSDDDAHERRELLVMITSRVLDPEEAARLSRKYEENFQERVRAAGAGF